MIVFNTRHVWKNATWDIKQANYYYIHDCQFNDTGDYDGLSCIDFQNGDGSQFIDVYLCIVTYGKGYWGGGIYFYGNFDFNIKFICIYSCKCKVANAIAYLDGGSKNKFNLTYLSSSHCLIQRDPLYLKYFHECSNNNVSFTPAYDNSGVVCLESEYDNLKIDYNSFYNNTCPKYIVYFYTSKYNTFATNCNVINNKIEWESVIVYNQAWSSICLYLFNFYIYGNQGKYAYYTYKTRSSGKIFVENCTADSHEFSNNVYFTGEIINVTDDEHPIYPYYGTFGCDAIWPINIGKEIQTPYETAFQTAFETAHVTPFETAHVTPFETAHVTPFETAHVTPFETAHVTPFDTAHVTPFETVHVTPFETVHVTPFDTAHVTPFETVHVTPFDTAHVTPFETAHVTPFETLIQTPVNNPELKIPSQSLFETLIETPFESAFQTPQVTEGVQEKDLVLNNSLSSTASYNVVDESNHYMNTNDSPNDSNKLDSGKWIIIAASLSAFIIAVIVLSIYLYRKRISKQNESDSEIEMVEETVITSKENISLTIENPLFTTLSMVQMIHSNLHLRTLKLMVFSILMKTNHAIVYIIVCI
ncbi:hypothetical protein TVAG_087540 [Trichomonas vaginalis G3]|uniref:Uncharacterized protein n=1 Tax=Trichomonas vaginalis (strain ATCC PRA-98 / G3) TaxID=412133 RepID=A2FDT0_TRIV3|nr:bifunctional inhibitor/lipid-transfer protein/seed storage 2s albumin superfamily protein family [Trichomonas vaginalis G3]EAX96929.1 hypothetical protein TVAG_087540 [Trichomonas vaginalis G3]KAI5532624.1 bifunctional inhibitor/lipid-transfer protein/seed storage 2s albumin superfamily protein family [Trichomonas vaginalis G3]|eukprot:XP_001309859.1 hypothetical protein [Trichomonas vaginalis G3]